jgi:hypothetical protein
VARIAPSVTFSVTNVTAQLGGEGDASANVTWWRERQQSPEAISGTARRLHRNEVSALARANQSAASSPAENPAADCRSGRVADCEQKPGSATTEPLRCLDVREWGSDRSAGDAGAPSSNRHCWSRCRVLPVARASSRLARVLLRPQCDPRGGQHARTHTTAPGCIEAPDLAYCRFRRSSGSYMRSAPHAAEPARSALAGLPHCLRVKGQQESQLVAR